MLNLAKLLVLDKQFFDYDVTSKGATNYLNLARELLQRNNMTKIKNEEKILE